MCFVFFRCRAVDPGAVETNIMHELPSYIQAMAFISLKILRLMQSSEDAAESVIDAALAPPVRYALLEIFYFFLLTHALFYVVHELCFDLLI